MDLTNYISELILLAACIFGFISTKRAVSNCKQIAATLYLKLYEIEHFGEKKISPYTPYYRIHSQSKEWGYTIMKNGQEMSSNNSIQFFYHASGVKKKIHELERMGGYILTDFGDDESE